jgi:hypothetical protein
MSPAMNLHLLFATALAILVLFSTPAAVAQEPSAYPVLLEVAKEVQHADGCPLDAGRRALNSIHDDDFDDPLTYFGVNQVAYELMFKECYSQAEPLFSFVVNSRHASDYEHRMAQTGLTRTLARR